MDKPTAPEEPKDDPTGQSVSYASHSKLLNEKKVLQAKFKENEADTLKIKEQLEVLQKAENERVEAKKMQDGKANDVIEELRKNLAEKDTQLSEFATLKSEIEQEKQAKADKLEVERLQEFAKLSPELQEKYKDLKLPVSVIQDMVKLQPEVVPPVESGQLKDVKDMSFSEKFDYYKNKGNKK